MAGAQIEHNREMCRAGSNVNGPSEIPRLASRLRNKSPIEVQLAGSGHDKCYRDWGSGCCGALGREKRGQWNDLPNPSLIEGIASGGSGGHPIIITISKSLSVRWSRVRGGGGPLTPTGVPALLHLLWMVTAWKEAPSSLLPARQRDIEIGGCSLNRPITLTPPRGKTLTPDTLALDFSFRLSFTWRQTHKGWATLSCDVGPRAGRIWYVTQTGGQNKSWRFLSLKEFWVIKRTLADHSQPAFQATSSLSYQSRPTPHGGPHITTHKNIKRPLW